MSALQDLQQMSTLDVRNRAKQLRDQKQYREAIATYSEVIDVQGEGTPPDYHNRGYCHAELGDYEAAIRDYSESISLGGISAIHLTYYTRGQCHSELKQHEEAISDCTETIRLRDDYANAYYDRAVCHRNLNHAEEALSDINEAIRLQPEDGTNFYERGAIKMHCVNDYESALSDINEAMRLGDENEYSYRERGECYRLLNQFDNSLQDFNHSIELNPNYALAYDSRGFLFQKMNRFEEAIADYEKALQLEDLNPNERVVTASRLERVRQLGSLDRSDSEVDSTRGIVVPSSTNGTSAGRLAALLQKYDLGDLIAELTEEMGVMSIASLQDVMGDEEMKGELLSELFGSTFRERVRKKAFLRMAAEI